MSAAEPCQKCAGMAGMPADARRLHLLRHAKSSWDSPSASDHDRPLAPRGRRAASALAGHFGRIRPPDLVLCSSARRTVETLDHLRPALPDGVPVSVEPGLYGADAGALLGRLHRVPADTATVLVVGHNPGLGELALELVGDGDPSLLARLRGKYPTGALATVSFGGPWQDLDWGEATLEAFVVPADLTGGSNVGGL